LIREAEAAVAGGAEEEMGEMDEMDEMEEEEEADVGRRAGQG
jgi:hypothetical protein